jgi:hypothetical protein
MNQLRKGTQQALPEHDMGPGTAARKVSWLS